MSNLLAVAHRSTNAKFRITLAVVALGVAGCSNSDSPRSETVSGSITSTTTAPPEGTTSSPETTTTAPAEPTPLTEALLILEDMPAGWTTAPELLEDDEEDDGVCNFEQVDLEENEAEAAFKEGLTGPFVLHAVGGFDDEPAAEAFMDDFAAFAARCQSSVADGVETTMSPLSFPAVAEESLAYRMSIDDPETTSVDVNVVLFRAGDRVAFLAVFGLFESPDAELTEMLVDKAAQRL